MSKWLENLQRLPPTHAAPVLGKVNEFSDLFDAADQGGLPVVAGTKLSKVFDDGASGASDDPDPIGMLLQKLERNPEAEGRHDAKPHIHPPAEELAEIEAGWNELLGSHAIGSEDGTKAAKHYEHARTLLSRMFQNHPDEREEALALVCRIAVETAVNDTSKAAGGDTLAKSELQSRMLKLFNQICDFCQGEEAALLQKSIRALDFTCFAEVAEPVLERMKKRAA